MTAAYGKFAVLIAGLATAAAFNLAATPAYASPKVLKQVPPEYPRGAERRGIEGYVVVKYTVAGDGSVANPQVVEGQPAGVFDSAALKAVEKWKYEQTGAETPDVQIKLRFEQ